MFRELLEIWAPDFAVRQVTSSPEVLEVLEREIPSLILLDLGLPRHLAPADNMEGLALLAVIRDQLKLDVPVIVVTRQTDPEIRERAFKMGANAFLAKPVKLDELEATIKQLCVLEKGDLS